MKKCRKCDMRFSDGDSKLDHEIDQHYFCINCDEFVGVQEKVIAALEAPQSTGGIHFTNGDRRTREQ